MAGLQIDPVRLDLEALHPITQLTIHNDGDQATLLQMNTVAWSQRDGKDVYADTRDVLVTPPIVTVPAGASQTVRIGLRGPDDQHQETSYRLYLQEVPQALPAHFHGMQMVLRIGIPVFVHPPVETAPTLDWHAVRHGNALTLALRNSGTAHIQLVYAHLGKTPVSGNEHISGYVLPGQTREWAITPGQAAGALHAARLSVTAMTDRGEIRAQVPIATP